MTSRLADIEARLARNVGVGGEIVTPPWAAADLAWLIEQNKALREALVGVVEKWDAMYGRVRFVGTKPDSIEGGLEFDSAMDAARAALGRTE